MKKSISHLHNPHLDRIRDDAHSFVTELGLQPASKNKIAVMLPSEGEKVTAELGRNENVRAGYIKGSGEVYTVAGKGTGSPADIQTQDTSLTVHELVHSDSLVEGEHSFYAEALPGMAEHLYLDAHSKRPRSPKTFTSKGVELQLPGEYRYPGVDNKPNTSQALVAAYGVGLSLSLSRLHFGDFLDKAHLNDRLPYELIRYSIAQLEGNLPEQIQRLPQNASGIIAAVGLLQEAARRKGVLSSR